MDVLQPQTTGVLVAGVLSLSLLYWLSTRRPAGLPPGPGPALPLLGHLLLLERDPRAQFRQWRRQYGDVFSYYVGSQLVVVLNGLDVLKEAFIKTADVFSHRPPTFFRDKLNEGRGKRHPLHRDFWDDLNNEGATPNDSSNHEACPVDELSAVAVRYRSLCSRSGVLS